ncbi:thiamine pyrophosphate-dependent enzyme, partial [Desulfococcaceae bacterium OttesenSCG-928-F15]|nr:thiamine pyrophosphate-dependent enzyme [Desulfococcaceae bacterium OttesenSCG-928-F15]
QGNEAIVRGALEAGIHFVAAYPGSPSSEILTMLGHMADELGFYAEWSTNETCALEACIGASFAHARSLCIMKQNGLMTAGDALHTCGLSGVKGGLVLIVADDPAAHSSTNEFDSRNMAISAKIPMLEPSTIQEAKDMIPYAFDLSETLQQIVMIRTVTRINHGRANVVLGELPKSLRPLKAIGEWDRLVGINWFHELQWGKMDQAGEIFEKSPFNHYEGPENPELLVITSGTGRLYSREALDALSVKDKVGVFSIGTSWPLPEMCILEQAKKSGKILVIEEVDPFLERGVAAIVGHDKDFSVEILGKGKNGILPRVSELDPDLVRRAIAKVLGVDFLDEALTPAPATGVTARELTFCAGCPHRASFFIVKQALQLTETQGVVMGDIGCYTLGAQRAGHYLISFLGCMGAGVNAAEGLGQLNRLGFDQPVVALSGDSTFFHSCLPGLVNARYHNANMLFVILDNAATAMTGFQPHPGIGKTAMGHAAEPVSIERVVEAIGCPVTLADPFDVEGGIRLVYKLLKEPGLKVLIFKQPCVTAHIRKIEKAKIWVDPELCRGDACGCGRFCSRIWGCPGNIWDDAAKRAAIDEVVCTGCGVCVSLCPAGAIKMAEKGAV